MQHAAYYRLFFGVGIFLATALTGCAPSERPLYFWGTYEAQIYQYFKGDGADVDAQQIRLEADLQKAAAKGMDLPPGFHAHRGLLYLKAGQFDPAQRAFEAEKAAFPESAAYIDSLLNKKP